MERKRASRTSGAPQLTIPDILVNDGSSDEGNKPFELDDGPVARWTHLSVGEGAGQELSTGRHPLSDARSSRLGATSGFSFELHESEGGEGQGSEQARRRGSAVSPSQARDMLDGSVWVESIRRSATLRRPGSRYGAD